MQKIVFEIFDYEITQIMVVAIYALKTESNYEYSKFGFCISLITCVI